MPLLFNVNLSVLHSQLYPCVPSRPLHFLLSNLPLFTESPPLSISLVLSFAVSQLTKHFFFAFLCFSFPLLISPLLSQSFTLLQLATFSLTLLFFFPLSAAYPNLSSPSLSPSFSCSQWKTSAVTRETVLETNKQWGYSARCRAMASLHLATPPEHWESRGRCPSWNKMCEIGK